ncbi:DUF6088 family protein [Plebeiibacterium sediminum]|uniref:DUF6088 family protein n=1 Tax=Plebeiibacterium sediminum TaxID=2992112 RepID=A0AAE3M933_9BACT|nr:DUF6088 family protein [Plebeiobacterium sediminum]MCW3789394.1 DUF6088 family protein [Plebeiobacterium sediminum]
MNLAKEIRNQINKMPEGEAFGYLDLGISKKDFITAAKALERLQSAGVIKKVSKGKFYKPKQTVFGELEPDYNNQLNTYLFQNGKRIAYVTGISLYNQMGLTTQVANQISIASRIKRIYINRGALKADAVKSYADVTESNYKLLGILDALKDIKKIPDGNIENSIKLLTSLIKQQNGNQLKMLVNLALVYPPRVKALLGAILENIDANIEIAKLKKNLNPLTKYKVGIKPNELPTIKNWNIV